MLKFWPQLLSWPADRHLLTESSHDRVRETRFSGISSSKGTDPIMRAPPSWPHLNLITFPKDPSLNIITLGNRASAYKSEGTQTFIHNTFLLFFCNTFVYTLYLFILNFIGSIIYLSMSQRVVFRLLMVPENF